ncbi:hypothetical protein [Fibrella forsythiae]|uniref:Uncharacterized protein n=1 Tax=Fibrella forsythiae TaxID=2817061 RepID=A0ABS3JLB4_9BACT|nr:hypothetical protein [Fibrella forsythiae]MBO0950233.1 hypothetical protein [Fibrella forsythiae]
MKADKQQLIDELAKRAEAILEDGMIKADGLLIKNASLHTQLDQFKREVSERLAQQGKSESFHP